MLKTMTYIWNEKTIAIICQLYNQSIYVYQNYISNFKFFCNVEFIYDIHYKQKTIFKIA